MKGCEAGHWTERSEGGDFLGQTHYKMISCNIWLPVVIHRSKTRNNALDVFWGIETIIMPLSRQPQKKVFLPCVSLPRANFYENIFYNAFAMGDFPLPIDFFQHIFIIVRYET